VNAPPHNAQNFTPQQVEACRRRKKRETTADLRAFHVERDATSRFGRVVLARKRSMFRAVLEPIQIKTAPMSSSGRRLATLPGKRISPRLNKFQSACGEPGGRQGETSPRKSQSG
jgi:hypothetical protein